MDYFQILLSKWQPNLMLESVDNFLEELKANTIMWLLPELNIYISRD